MSPKVQMTFRPASPNRSLCGAVALEGDHRHSVRNDVNGRPGYAIDAGQEVGCDAGHHDDPLAVGGQVLNQSPRQRVWLGQERVEGGDDRLAALAHEVQHAPAPIPGIEAELVLQAHHVAGSVVGHFRREMIRLPLAVVDDVDHARIVVAERGGLLDRRNRRHRIVRRHVHGVRRVASESRQSAGFRRISR